MNLFGLVDFGFIDIVDIVVVAVLLWYLYRLLRGTMAINIFIGIIVIYAFWKVTELLHMEFLSSIIGGFIKAGFFALIVVFQEEIRRFLLLIGSSSVSKRGFLSHLFEFAKKKKNITDVTSVVRACETLSKTYTGALIVFERSSSLHSFKLSGDEMKVIIDSAILCHFFKKESPLHDGAVIISDNIISATRAILPLTNRNDLPHRYGLRHRAAVGITETTDAVALVVSEETGTVFYVRDGQFVQYDAYQELITIIKSDLN